MKKHHLPRIVPSGKQSKDRVTRVSAGIGLLQSEVLSSLTHFCFTCHQLGNPGGLFPTGAGKKKCKKTGVKLRVIRQNVGEHRGKRQNYIVIVACTIENTAKKTQTNRNKHLASSVQLDIFLAFSIFLKTMDFKAVYSL